MNVAKIKQRIHDQDYHGTLATRLYICLKENRPPDEEMIQELEFLQKNHKIH